MLHIVALAVDEFNIVPGHLILLLFDAQQLMAGRQIHPHLHLALIAVFRKQHDSAEGDGIKLRPLQHGADSLICDLQGKTRVCCLLALIAQNDQHKGGQRPRKDDTAGGYIVMAIVRHSPAQEPNAGIYQNADGRISQFQIELGDENQDKQRIGEVLGQGCVDGAQHCFLPTDTTAAQHDEHIEHRCRQVPSDSKAPRSPLPEIPAQAKQDCANQSNGECVLSPFQLIGENPGGKRQPQNKMNSFGYGAQELIQQCKHGRKPPKKQQRAIWQAIPSNGPTALFI